jgi:hypothetical protein
MCNISNEKTEKEKYYNLNQTGGPLEQQRKQFSILSGKQDVLVSIAITLTTL